MPCSTPLRAVLALLLGLTGACSEPLPPAGAPQVPIEEEFSAIATRLLEGRNVVFGRAELERLRLRLARPAKDPASRIEVLGKYVVALLQAGEVDAAAEHIEAALDLARQASAPDRLMASLWRLRGTVHLRKAELENCVRRHDAECCILPLRPGGLHTLPGPAQEARRSYEQALALQPGDTGLMWLLNVTATLLGEHPEGVPEPWRIELSAEEPAGEESAGIGLFRDVAAQVGVDDLDLAGGVIAEDFDGDGLLDLVTSTSDPRAGLRFYRGRPGMAFEDATEGSRLEEQLGGLDCIATDYDGDGDVDVYVLRGAWLFDEGCIRNSLLENDGHGVFTDVTYAVGLAEPAYPSQAACWGDFDADGDLDLYVVNESRLEIGPPVGDFPAQLFQNDGGRFTDVADRAGVTNDRYAKGVAAGDFDNDGDLDLYVSNVGRNRLYENRGDGTFEDVAEALGVVEPAGRSFATWFFDFDNDGWLDLFVAGFEMTIADLGADRLGRPHAGVLSRLYRNTGGRFEDVSARVGLTHPYLPMGANFGDFDNDGYLDVYLGTGEPSYETLMPDVALWNDHGRRLRDVTASSGLGHLQKGHGIAFADLDEDGDQDIFHQIGGFYLGDAFPNALFENPGNGNHHLHVRLVGTRSNTAAYGARIEVVVEEDGAERSIQRAVGCVSSFGGSPARQEIGLGAAARIVRLAVDWPTSGERQEFRDVPLDARIVIEEGAARWRFLDERSEER